MKGRVASFRFAFAGLTYLLRTQPNARIHIGVTLAVLALGLWLGLGRLEWAVLWLAVGLVWATESLNTAIEALIDLTHPQFHPLAKAGKDAAAAGVLLAAGTATLIGLFVLGPPLWARIFGG